MMKKVQQMSTMLPMGFRLLISVMTTSFTPGARLITRSGLSARSNRSTRITPKILGESAVDSRYYRVCPGRDRTHRRSRTSP